MNPVTSMPCAPSATSVKRVSAIAEMRTTACHCCKEKASPAEAGEADRTRTFRQAADAPKGPRLVGVWPRRSITLAALWAAQWFSFDDAPGLSCPAAMLTRCRVFRWLLATELLLEGGAEAAPVQTNQLQAVSLRPARALPLRLDQPLVRRPCLHRQICGATGAHLSIGPFCRYGRTFPGRSARETFAARLSSRAAPHGAVRPRPFSLLCLLGRLAHGCHPMLAFASALAFGQAFNAKSHHALAP